MDWVGWAIVALGVGCFLAGLYVGEYREMRRALNDFKDET